MKRLFSMIVVMVLVMLAVYPGLALAQSTDPASVMAAFCCSAVPDPDAQVQLLADDVTMSVDPPPPGSTGVWTGKEQVRQFLKRNQAENVRRELVGGWQVAGNTVRGTVLVSNTNFDLWGVGKVEHTLEAVVENGKIASFRASMCPAERPRVAAGRATAQPSAALPATGGSVSSVGLIWLLVLAGLMLVLGLALRHARVRTR